MNDNDEDNQGYCCIAISLMLILRHSMHFDNMSYHFTRRVSMINGEVMTQMSGICHVSED